MTTGSVLEVVVLVVPSPHEMVVPAKSESGGGRVAIGERGTRREGRVGLLGADDHGRTRRQRRVGDGDGPGARGDGRDVAGRVRLQGGVGDRDGRAVGPLLGIGVAPAHHVRARCPRDRSGARVAVSPVDVGGELAPGRNRSLIGERGDLPAPGRALGRLGAQRGAETFSPVWSAAVPVDFVGAVSSDRKVVPCGRSAVVNLIVPESGPPLAVTFVKVLSGPS